MSEARFAVGIDLGTTHCVMAYTDLSRSEGETVVQDVVPIPQLTAPGAIEERPVLPSFLYLPHDSELSAGDRTLPWGESGSVIGELGREMGSRTPIRLVSSAKSWLCHPGVDRRAGILPVEAPEEVQRISPVEASLRYLQHLRNTWNQAFPEHPLQQQEVTVTVPASFDPAARELTAEAARAALGCEHLILLEEPQAAVYSWLLRSGGEWRKQVKVGDVILIVDVGGGTTDLSLVAVTERDGSLELNRIAVGDHILLGGDNMDLALAHVVRAKLAREGKQLQPWQLQALTHGCRAAKETLLSDPSVGVVPVVVPSRGSNLIGGTLRTELSYEEVAATVVEGFFPHVAASARPAARARTALTRLGLPFAQDAAVSRHLAAFLGRQTQALGELEGFRDRQPEGAEFLQPTAVLFNGGVFRAGMLSDRLMHILNDWLGAAGAEPARLLQGADLDLAVARGAAYYGFVRQGRGVRIRGGTAKSFYVGIESAMPAVPGIEPPVEALCVAPFGIEEGSEAQLPDREVGLVVGEPVRFRFFGSSVRREDQVGTVLDFWTDEELEELEPIEAHLDAPERQPGDVVPVRLHAAVTELGTLRLEAVPRDGEQRWKVEFDVRGSEEAA